MMNKTKIATVAALVLAFSLSLSACSSVNENNNNKGEGTSQTEHSNTGKAKFSIKDIEDDPTKMNGAFNGEVIYERFGWSGSSDVREQLLAASVAGYLDQAIYNPYFTADWWGMKDDFSPKGLSYVQPFTDDKFYESLKETIATESGRELVGSNGSIFIQPKSIVDTGIVPNPPCFEDWIKSGCMSSDKKETFEVISKNEGSMRAKVTSSFTIYVADENGNTLNQPVQYEATFKFTNNNRLKDLKKDPFYAVTAIAGKITYGEPKA